LLEVAAGSVPAHALGRAAATRVQSAAAGHQRAAEHRAADSDLHCSQVPAHISSMLSERDEAANDPSRTVAVIGEALRQAWDIDQAFIDERLAAQHDAARAHILGPAGRRALAHAGSSRHAPQTASAQSSSACPATAITAYEDCMQSVRRPSGQLAPLNDSTKILMAWEPSEDSRQQPPRSRRPSPRAPRMPLRTFPWRQVPPQCWQDPVTNG
jgi:hypothetical protein